MKWIQCYIRNGFVTDLKDYGVLIGIFALILGILIKSDLWLKTVFIEPGDPLVRVDLHKLKTVMLSKGLDSDFKKIQKQLKVDIQPNSNQFIYYYLDWYQKIPNLGSKDNKRVDYLDISENTQLTKKNIAEVLANNRLVEAKKAFRYVDKDSTLLISGKICYGFSNTVSLEKMKINPAALEYNLRLNDEFNDYLYTTSAFLPVYYDPFYTLFEQIEDKERKALLYECVHQSCDFLSWFILQNKGKKDAIDTKITLDLSQNRWELLSGILQKYNIIVANRIGDIINLRVPYLQHGPLDYKIIIVKTHDTPVKPNYIHLDEKGILEDVAQHYVILLIVPLLLIILKRFFCGAKAAGLEI